jgi:peptide/nickel transport system ATP-binding protein
MFITHALGVIAEMADDVVVMYLGEEVEVADVDAIYYRPSHPYTQALLRSIPRHDARLDRLATIEGNVPDPTNMPEGCKFHPRCPHYVPAKCADPPRLRMGDQHWVKCARAREIAPPLAETEAVS